MPIQAAVSIRADVVAGRIDAVKPALVAAERDLSDETSPLATVGSVHFARLLVVPGLVDPKGGSTAESVMYMADIDGPPRRHLKALSEHAGPIIDAVFSNCTDYPDRPDASQRYRWLRAHQTPVAVEYVNTMGRGAVQIGEEAALHDWLESYLDEHRAELAEMEPVTIHHTVREAVAGTPEVRFAVHPAPDVPMAHRVWSALQVVVTVVFLVVASPILLVIALAALPALHRLEKTDAVSTQRPDADSVKQLRAQEDQFACNPFAAVGVLKPGPLRRRTVMVVLRAIAFAVQHVFNRGSLAGVTTIHFARWVVLDGYQRVLFTSYYDGSLESYMDDFIDKLSWGLNVIFSNGLGYPRTNWLLFGGARNEQAFKDYLRFHQIGTPVSYAAYPPLTCANIVNNAEVRAGLARTLPPDEARTWLARL